MSLVKEGSSIRLLSTHVANKIAAGEVVERPASVVKELLENSIDAGATRIDVVVTSGGRKLISIADNGIGMNRDDALMAPERQATSKIKDVDDIEHIETLGFRGEALASIASVSRFTLRTRRHNDDIGTEISITGGTMHDVSDCGCPPGTVIEVRDLFFNVPARRSFLRSFPTEQSHIKNIFIQHAIANPHVAFSLKCDGDLTYQLPASNLLADRLTDLFGHEEMEHLLRVDGSLAGIRVYGYAGNPLFTRYDRSGQYVFVNNRPATAPVIQSAIKDAYPKLDEERRPIVYLFIDISPNEVDVNVHPTKREVRFRKTADVRNAVISAISATLIRLDNTTVGGDAKPVFSTESATTSASPSENANTFAKMGVENIAPVPAYAAPPIIHHETHIDFSDANVVKGRGKSDEQSPREAESSVIETPSGVPWSTFRIIGRLKSGYILIEMNDGYTVCDPGASHERVIYEEMLSDMSGKSTLSQKLLVPQTIKLKPIEARCLEKNMLVLKSMGFGIESFGGDTFIVDSLPDAIADAPAENVILDIVMEIEEAGSVRGKEKWKEELFARAASRSAVRAKSKLSEEELISILNRLASCVMPYTSPYGSPTMIFISNRELNRRFGKAGNPVK